MLFTGESLTLFMGRAFIKKKFPVKLTKKRGHSSCHLKENGLLFRYRYVDKRMSR